MRSRADEAALVARLRPWLQNVHLPSGRQTAPAHPLGDWPRRLWDGFREHVGDLRGRRVLDVGCNAGFYCIEAARRGAEVVGLEPNPRYLDQARFTVRAWGLEDRITLRPGQVYDLAHGEEGFDVVLLLGVLYHLRYPMLALDALARACRGTLFLQSLMTPGRPAGDGAPAPLPDEVDGDLSALDAPDWPKLAFVEDRLFGDPTNRWVPNPQGVEAMARKAGFRVEARAAGHVFVCRRVPATDAWAEAEFRSATGRRWSGGASFAPVPGTLESRT